MSLSLNNNVASVSFFFAIEKKDFIVSKLKGNQLSNYFSHKKTVVIFK